jgi:serine/threonine-protein kinase HipA
VRVLSYVAGKMGMPDHTLNSATRAVMDYVLHSNRAQPARRTTCDLKMWWNHRHIADLVHNGIEWEFNYTKDWVLPLSFFERRRSSRLPPFIEALMPETGKTTGVTAFDIEVLKTGVKYLSNICITPDDHNLQGTPHDLLQGKLANFSVNGIFTGKVSGIDAKQVQENFVEHMKTVWKGTAVPRISGIQRKLPMTLDAKGNLFPARDTPFTHILKFPGTEDWEAMGGVEWFCLETARRAGLNVTKTALIANVDGLAPAVLSERWDIRQGPNDRRLLVSEDFCSVMGLPPDSKFDSNMDDVARKLLLHSTNPDLDSKEFLRHAVANWLVANGDYHLKNMSFLKVAAPTLDHFESVRLAPAYDMLCSRIFPRFYNDGLSLPIAGKRDNLSMRDFLDLAETCKVRKQEAMQIVESIAREMARHALAIYEPLMTALQRFPTTRRGITFTTEMVVNRAANLLEEKPENLMDELTPRARAKSRP